MSTIEFIKPISPETMIPARIIGIKEGEVETEMVTLQLSKIDQVWRKDRFSYSGLGGSDRKESKIKGVETGFPSTIKFTPQLFTSQIMTPKIYFLLMADTRQPF